MGKLCQQIMKSTETLTHDPLEPCPHRPGAVGNVHILHIYNFYPFVSIDVMSRADMVIYGLKLF